jgi:ribosomal protein L5
LPLFEEKGITTQAKKKHSPHKLRKRGHFGTGTTVRKRIRSLGIRRVAGLT